MAAIDHFPWRYNHWQKHPELFEPQEKHIAVSINSTAKGVMFSKSEIGDEDIPGLCGKTSTNPLETKWSLHLILTPEPSVRTLGIVPYSLAAVQALRSSWRIPHLYIPSFDPSRCMTMSFTPVLGDANWKGLFFALPTSAGSILALVYNVETYQTFGICADIQEEQVIQLVQRLEDLQNFSSNPFVVPIVLAGFVIYAMGIENDDAWLNYASLEKVLRRGRLDNIDATTYTPLNSDEELSKIPMRLTNTVIKITEQNHRTSVLGTALERLEHELRALPGDYRRDISAELQDQITYSRRVVAIHQNCTSLIKDKEQSLVQLVYALLQQKDNQLNHRYGADMRLITAITLIFLPGTFVATFFSTSFWDFSPDNNGTKISAWVWLYFLITISLTMLVLGVWRKYGAVMRCTAALAGFCRQSRLGKRLAKEKFADEEIGLKAD